MNTHVGSRLPPISDEEEEEWSDAMDLNRPKVIECEFLEAFRCAS
jgi:hypothetical protein